MGFEDEGWGHKPRNAVVSRSWQRQGNIFSMEPLTGIQPCLHLDFSSVKGVSNF